MELTRRDALAVLAGAGIVGGGGAAVTARRETRETESDGETAGSADVTAALSTLVAAAEVLYPSETTGVREFVETYVEGRRDRDEYAAGVTEAAAAIDEAARGWYDAPYAELDRETRDAVLRELGAEEAHPDPEGSRAERVRYFVVNDLLYALYTSPTGAELVGASNPVGYPGGTEAYQRKP
ncbi:gluconate 2-dehydrogenase subunit 3 family protein [Halomarina litorea]|uniref:gluconate 2-dehydrogenase subunit 3 family protein n=1 Tax=Halomarina litorea TaxID=2961595 RepID=UPI0020C567DA|nr:gluconate 2-dehydrogenase subunit 3 family protein [Halomarina sp. BCD28]